MLSGSRVSFIKVAAVASWLVLVGAGFASVWHYAYTAGPAAETSLGWPGHLVSLDHDRATLVIVLHPECACSRASVGELARIMTHADGRLAATVLISTSAGETPSDSLRNSAAAIPGVNVMFDGNGVEAARFGARVSGQVFVYNTHAQLIFEGGITASRGHDGDNDGVQAVLAAVHQRPSLERTPVFGCLLSSRSAS